MVIDYYFVMDAENHIQLSSYLSYVSGALAGCAATIGSYPFDLLRTILASQGEPKVWNTDIFIRCIYRIFQLVALISNVDDNYKFSFYACKLITLFQ